jgi:hypothetical protein
LLFLEFAILKLLRLFRLGQAHGLIGAEYAPNLDDAWNNLLDTDYQNITQSGRTAHIPGLFVPSM